MTQPTLTYDEQAHAAYVAFAAADVVQTLELLDIAGGLILVDLDAAGQIVGVEIVLPAQEDGPSEQMLARAIDISRTRRPS